MSNNHLKYFKVENFKKFESLEVNNIGQINLIVGDNNVGKTCLLESLCLEFSAKKTISGLSFILDKRKIENDNIVFLSGNEEFNFNYNLVGMFQRDKSKPIRLSKDNKIYSIYNKNNFNPSQDEKVAEFVRKVDLFQYKGINQLSKNWIIFESSQDIEYLIDVTSSYYKSFYNYNTYLPLIKIDDLYGQDLIEFYQDCIKNPNDEDKIISYLNEIFPSLNIKRLAIFEYINKTDYIHLSTDEMADYHPIAQYGDGFIKVVRVLLELFFMKDKFICIDEIDNGIHYSKQKEFWKIIFRICKELNVQLFATTHSKECLESLIEASEEDVSLQESIRLIKLNQVENSDKIKAITYPYNEFEYLVESNSETR